MKNHDMIHTQQATLNHLLMREFAILTNRKRALIALAHSVVFLGIALHGFVSRKAGIIHGSPPASDFLLVMVYLTVTSILAWLVGISRCVVERLYFALCASSATFGLLRIAYGDPALPLAQYLRVVMLTSAVIVGARIFRSFARPVPEDVPSE
jgi:hypothetical protein